MRALALTLVLATAPACVTSRYTPRDSPWISTVLDGGIPRFRVNGHTYTTLADATAIDPEAHALLTSGQSDFLWGGVIAMTGSVVLSLGLTDVLVLSTVGESIFGNSNPTLGLAILGVGLGGMIGGLVLAASGERDRLDAINLFNDHMFERWLRERGHEPIAPLAPTPTPDPIVDP